MFDGRLRKWGNSLGIRIPSSYVKDFDLKNGSSVDIVQEKGRLVILPKRVSLNELLEKVTEGNRHDAIETGKSVGKEEW
jgi:antitoxin MazE